MNGNTFIWEPGFSSSFAPYPQSYIAPGITNHSYVYRRVFNGVSFTSGNSAVITAGTDENFVGATSSSNASSTVMDNFLVIVTNATGSSRNVGDQVAVTTLVTSSTPEQATLFTGNTID